MFWVKMLCLLDSQGVIFFIYLVQLKIVSVCSEKPICAAPCFSEVFPMLPLKQFQCLMTAVSCPFKEDCFSMPQFLSVLSSS